MEMNDEKLYKLCQKYGEITLKYRRKFMGLLPKVYKRELFKKKGFSEHSFSEKPAVAPLSHVTLSLSKGELFLTTEVQQKLLELQQKDIDINQLIMEFLNKREEEIENKKEEITEEQQENFIKYNITESDSTSRKSMIHDIWLSCANRTTKLRIQLIRNIWKKGEDKICLRMGIFSARIIAQIPLNYFYLTSTTAPTTLSQDVEQTHQPSAWARDHGFYEAEKQTAKAAQ